LPTLQARAYYDLVALDLEVQGQQVPDRPFEVIADHLAVGLVYDLPEAMKHLTQDGLDDWGVTFYEALEAARENLVQLPSSFLGPSEGEGLWCSVTKDSYDAARLLLVDTLRGLRVRGDLVAMVPNRETLLVAGTDDPAALEGMLTLAEEALQQPRRISGIAFQLDGDQWTPWLPDMKHPLYHKFRKLHVQSIGQDYAEQKSLMEKRYEQTGENIFVASFSGMSRPGTEEMTTYCVWSKGVLSLLPRTDLVAFVQQGQQPLLAPWDRVVDVAGDLMEATRLYPERFRVAEFPTASQLAAMGARPTAG
jgi:hypothetical protein